jgi:hypothetical protein
VGTVTTPASAYAAASIVQVALGGCPSLQPPGRTPGLLGVT